MTKNWNGEEIRLLRKRLRLSQEELAREIDVTLKTISRWENSTIEVRPKNARALDDLDDRY